MCEHTTSTGALNDIYSEMFHSEDADDGCVDEDDMFCGSMAVLEEQNNNEILDKDKAAAQQLLDLLPDNENVGLVQHLRAFVSGVVLPPNPKQNKNKRKKVNKRQLRAQGLKKMFVIH